MRREGDVKRDVNTVARYCGRVTVTHTREESRANRQRKGERKGKEKKKEKRKGSSRFRSKVQSTRQHHNATPSTTAPSASLLILAPFFLPRSLLFPFSRKGRK